MLFTTRVNDNLTLTQDKQGLTFGSDALLLASYIRPGVANSQRTGVELGAGTGIVSLLAAARGKFGHITAVELQEKFADLCRHNVKQNQLDDKVNVICGDVRQLKAKDIGREVDAVFCNPPYMIHGSGKDCSKQELQVARHEVCGGIGDFVTCAAGLLKQGGRLYTVYRPDRLETLFNAHRSAGFAIKRMTFVHGRKELPPSVVLTEARLGGREGMYVTPPLIIRNEAGDTAEYTYILEKGNFPSEFYRA